VSQLSNRDKVGGHRCAAFNCGRGIQWFKPFCGRHEKMIPAGLLARLKKSDGRYRIDWDWDAIVEARALIAKLETKDV
jgi:hypothetical protein